MARPSNIYQEGPEDAWILMEAPISRDRIEAIVYCPMSDALRNHLITLAYVDLSDAMARLIGTDDANWCALAVWPSYTVGFGIRSISVSRTKQLLRRRLPAKVADRLDETPRQRVSGTGRVMSTNLAAGNRGVFYEIGLAWVDFIDTFGSGPRTDADFERFAERVMKLPAPPRRGWAQGDRKKLCDGFRAYLEVLRTDDRDLRAQLMLRGNLLIGDHEQRRLQGWLDRSMLAPIRRLTKRFDGDDGLSRSIKSMEDTWSWILTKFVFFVEMNGEQLRLGHRVPPHHSAGGREFPRPLDRLDPDAAAVFDEMDRAAAGGDGAERWNHIDDRMAYIATLFRSRQQAGLVGAKPYNDEERKAIKEQAAQVDKKIDLFKPADQSDTGDKQYLLFADVTEELVSPWPQAVDDEFNAMLVEARNRCDEDADGAVKAFYSGWPPIEHYYTEVLEAAMSGQGTSNGPLATFLAARHELPPWADMELIERAKMFYESSRTAALLGLFFGSIPLSYAAGEGCQVLGLISTLNPNPDRGTGDTVRRFWESTKFVEDVFTSDFWKPDSKGYASIRGVRLFHAAVRDTIESKSRHVLNWPPELNGPVWDSGNRPINQEDLLAATIDWSVATIHVMDRFGVPLTAEEAEAYFHTWLVVGHFLGVEEQLLMSPEHPERPLTLREAEYAGQVMFTRQLRDTEAGRRLMDGLLGLIDEWFPGPLRRLPWAMMYAAIGNDEIIRVLGLPPPGRTERAMVRLNTRARGWRRNKTYRRLARFVIDKVGEMWLAWWNENYQEIPPYRRGGHEAIETRVPVTLKLRIKAGGETGALPGRLHSIPGAEVETVRDLSPHGGFTTTITAYCQDLRQCRSVLRDINDGVDDIDDPQATWLLVNDKPQDLASITAADIESFYSA